MNHGYFDYEKKPEDPQFEPHAGINIAHVLGFQVYICVTLILNPCEMHFSALQTKITIWSLHNISLIYSCCAKYGYMSCKSIDESTVFVPIPAHAPVTAHQHHFQFKMCGTINGRTLKLSHPSGF